MNQGKKRDFRNDNYLLFFFNILSKISLAPSALAYYNIFSKFRLGASVHGYLINITMFCYNIHIRPLSETHFKFKFQFNPLLSF